MQRSVGARSGWQPAADATRSAAAVPSNRCVAFRANGQQRRRAAVQVIGQGTQIARGRTSQPQQLQQTGGAHEPGIGRPAAVPRSASRGVGSTAGGASVRARMGRLSMQTRARAPLLPPCLLQGQPASRQRRVVVSARASRYDRRRPPPPGESMCMHAPCRSQGRAQHSLSRGCLQWAGAAAQPAACAQPHPSVCTASRRCISSAQQRKTWHRLPVPPRPTRAAPWVLPAPPRACRSALPPPGQPNCIPGHAAGARRDRAHHSGAAVLGKTGPPGSRGDADQLIRHHPPGWRDCGCTDGRAAPLPAAPLPAAGRPPTCSRARRAAACMRCLHGRPAGPRRLECCGTEHPAAPLVPCAGST